MEVLQRAESREQVFDIVVRERRRDAADENLVRSVRHHVEKSRARHTGRRWWHQTRGDSTRWWRRGVWHSRYWHVVLWTPQLDWRALEYNVVEGEALGALFDISKLQESKVLLGINLRRDDSLARPIHEACLLHLFVEEGSHFDLGHAEGNVANVETSSLAGQLCRRCDRRRHSWSPPRRRHHPCWSPWWRHHPWPPARHHFLVLFRSDVFVAWRCNIPVL
mmetsp:Transcript_200/g.505  ORF Transcript_200/g.505 Transcript_200/m.505 type:complete len:221 (-) Transcript_200:950-1612(-)